MVIDLNTKIFDLSFKYIMHTYHCRRLRAGKSSIGLQTYLVPTKLLRDVNFGTQKDLLLFKDMKIQTDAFYTKKTNIGETCNNFL